MEHPTEMPQVALTAAFGNAIRVVEEERASLTILIFPAYAALLSSLALLIHAVAASRILKEPNEPAEDSKVDSDDDKSFWTRHGGKTIFAFRFFRLDAVLSLLVLDAYSAWKDHWGWESLVLAAAVDYMVFLAALNTFSTSRIATVASVHLTLVATTMFLVYAYRDLWPLATFTLRPLDESQGVLLWIKVALSAMAGLVIPLLEPYPYISAQLEGSNAQPNPEQTASIASFLFYTFLDKTIWKAYKLPHLSYDELPSLCDYDDAAALKKRGYPYLDSFSGAKKGNLFFGLTRMFKRTLFYQSAVLVLMALARLASPVATNRLLSYFEQGRESSFVKPWVWIILIALGPLTYSVTHELYQFLSAATCVRIESVITSLAFDHALRLRIKAEVSDSSSNSAAQTVDATALPSGEAGIAIAPPTDEPGAVTGDADLALVKDAVQMPMSTTGGENLSGKLNNLVTSDLDNITAGRDFLLVGFSAPLEIALSIWFLYEILGWSSIIGFIVMMTVFPVPTLGASIMDKTEERKMKATDARVQNVTEMMNSLRMIKLFGWESHAKEEASKKRDEELKWVWRRRMLEIANGIVNHVIPMLHMVVTFSIYTTVMKQELNASIVFSSLGAFNILREHLYQTFQQLPVLIRANVSLRRVSEFLSSAELLDSFTKQDEIIPGPVDGHTEDIGFGSADFTWSAEATENSTTPSKRRFRLSVDGDLVFKKSGFNVIVGPTGSGKTSVLMALLGEMHYIPTQPGSWLNLPREHGVAYAAQESWVQSESIRDNILFGAPFDEGRYQKVVYQCALRPDLKLLDAGDATEVGEKGITLSGGQKARITLARAIYSSADIILLDDVLSALDTHTARWIVTKCFGGDLVKGRTVILVTHNTPLVGPIADFVVSLSGDGKIAKQGTALDVLSLDPKPIEVEERDLKEPGESEDRSDAETKDTTKDGKLIVAEEFEVGRVGKAAWSLFLRALGGKWPVLFWSQYGFATLLSEIVDSLSFWWLGWWAHQYTVRERGEVSIAYYLGIYGLIILTILILHVWHTATFAGATIRSSRTIHQRLINALVGSTFRWLDTTPTSRVIARCTGDIQAVDTTVALYLSWLILLGMSMLVKLSAIVLYAPIFLVTAAVITAIGAYLAQVYMKAQLPVKREMSNAKAPVLGIFGGAVAGLTSIRAYGAQQAFKDETDKRINRYVRCARTYYSLNRWISVRIDALSATFAASLAAYFAYGSSSPDPSSIGFILVMAVSFSQMILFWVRIYNDFEVSGNSLERIQQYVAIEQEPEPKDHGAPPAYWPASGDLRVENLSARYSPDGPEILKGLSFHVQSGERIGIVGRTGAGKSTLALALLRCIYTAGAVHYDGLPTHAVNLDALRSNVTVIPQVPELLGGTLRANLDLFGRHDDATLHDALRAAGLYGDSDAGGPSGSAAPNKHALTLDTPVASGGGNFSVGQRQMIALARAIVRKSKLLILDEATSAIDYENDRAIQASLRRALARDVTVLTVAHRLQTIMDSDRIMVLDAGRIAEFDRPAALLRDPHSALRALVEESADRDALYAAQAA